MDAYRANGLSILLGALIVLCTAFAAPIARADTAQPPARGPLAGIFQALFREISSLESTITGFANNFVSAHITATTLDAGTLTVSNQLCAKKSDGTSVCATSDQLAALLANGGGSGTNQSPAAAQRSPTATSAPPKSVTSNSSSTTPPTITINGDNPAIINVDDSYADLGATVTDTGSGQAGDTNLGYKTFLNGTLVSNIVINTSEPATDTIDYVATDSSGETATSTRTVLIEPAATSSVN